jgi:hypothetical protein
MTDQPNALGRRQSRNFWLYNLMPSLLAGWIQSKLGETISREEANQLIFALFVSVDCLPDNLRSRVWDRAALAGEFVALVKEGIILDVDSSHEEADYWNSTITALLIDKKQFDLNFWSRIYEVRKA